MLNIRLRPQNANPAGASIQNGQLLSDLVRIGAVKPVDTNTYQPITVVGTQQRRIINPLTGNSIKNNYKNRMRVNEAIAKHNNTIQERVNTAIANVKVIKNKDYVYDKPNKRVIRSDVVFDPTRTIKKADFANKQIVKGILTGNDNVSVVKKRYESFTLNFDVKMKHWAGGDIRQKSFNFTIPVGNADISSGQSIRIGIEKRRELIQQTITSLELSDVDWVKFVSTTNRRRYINDDIVKMEDILMRDFKILNLDGEEVQNFNKGMGTCVIDFMRWYYNKPAYRLKKKLTDEHLNTIWSIYDWQNGGVSANMLHYWCKDNEIPMIAMDIDNNLIKSYFPEAHKRNKDAPSFVYRIHNEHIYPVIDKSLVKSFTHIFSESNTGFSVSKKKKDDTQSEQTYEIETIESVDNRIDFLVNKMYETNTEVMSKNMSFNGESGQLEFFIIGNKKYMFKDDNTELIKQYCANNNIKYTGQSPASFAYKATEQIKKSKPNSIVNKTLLTKGVKNRVHLGLIDNSNTIQDSDIGFDINKCYAHCIKNPYEKFMVLNFNDNWENFTENQIKLGLFYVETSDFSLFHGTNIYSTSIVKYGIEQGIITYNNIKYALYANDSMEKDVFHKVYENLANIANGNIDFQKLLGNITPGIMGKTHKYTYKKSISTSINEAFCNLSKQNFKDIFIQNNQTETHKKYYVYGTKSTTHYKEHSMPLWIQILDDSNIRLHKMGKDIGGEVIYRKTDYIVIRNPQNIITGTEPGQYKIEKLPTIIRENNNMLRDIDIDWSEVFDRESRNGNNKLKYYNVNTINNSNQHQQVINYINANRTLQIRGMGGVGKSHLIKNIINSGVFKPVTCAYTNMASENIDGQTINKLLGMDISCKISKKQLIKIGKKYDLIIVDEISMVPSSHWEVLYDIYNYTNCKFLFVGDWRQIPPIEEFNESFYLYHPLIMKLSGYSYCELLYNENSRCDKRLHDVVIKEHIDLSQFPTNKEHNVNICYYNKTRKSINEKCMLRNRGNKYITIPVGEITKDNEDCQDVSIFVGCPVIFRISDKKMNIVKNKRDKITNISKDSFTISSGQTFQTSEFHKFFNVCYCITVHKYQGQTIAEPFTIWDTDKMDYRMIYTALTRSKKYDYINIA
mgnify:CR=1 FL=1